MPNHPKTLAVAAALLASACSTPASGPTPLPPDVQAIVDRECGSCHSATPQGGAPMALVTWEAMHAPAVTDHSISVYEMVAMRIHDAVRPMPARGALPTSELAVLDAWIAAGAPPGDGSYTPPPPPEVGPEYLPCEPTAEFRAHAAGSDTQPFHLDPGAGAGGNSTLCFAFASPFGDTTQGTAFAPIIDDARVVHHWIIFGSEALPPGVSVGDVYECGATGGGLSSTTQFLTGWAPGGLNSVYPADQGRELPGPTGFIILQVHYWNVNGYDDVLDRSGVALCSTDTPRPHEIGTSILGSLDIQINPHENNHTVVGTCTPAITEPVTIVGSGPHMHTHGVSIRTDVIRGGTSSPQMLVDIPHWDFNSQTGAPAPDGAFVVNPGDMLRTTCVYDNNTDEIITFGERTEDEMCFNFVSAYPTGALATEIGRARRLCID
jgi:hypothetical protein